MMKRWKKFMIGSICSVILIAGIGYGVLTLCPDATSHITRAAFASGEGYIRADSYEANMKKIETVELNYPSIKALHNFELYYPKDKTQSYPIIIWVHGGAFVGGDLKDTRDFLCMVASEGYVVVNMNYELAPEAVFPSPILQIDEMSAYLSTLAAQYPMDTSQVFLGGDSAGANLAGCYVNAVMNDTYASSLSIHTALSKEQIKGYLSFCGLLDIMAYDETDSWLSNFLFKQSARSYFDTWNWKQSEQAKLANFAAYIQDFPPVYLTDGAQNSFLTQTLRFQQQLDASQIPVTSTLFTQPLPHEYQFQMEKEEAQTNLQQVLVFLAANHH